MHGFGAAAAAYSTALSGASADLERCVLLCNRAAAYSAMDLNRKALADVDAALVLDPACLRALMLKGDVLVVT